MKPISFLVIGESQTGKTHFGGQLLKRLQNRMSPDLQLDRSPDSISLFEEVLKCLDNGNAAGHTNRELYNTVTLKMRYLGHDQPVDLEWPDYGGEQVRDIVNLRRLSTDWAERSTNADGWLLFLRPSSFKSVTDIFERPKQATQMRERTKQASASQDTPPKPKPAGWPDQMRFVELLQILLFARSVVPGARLQRPHLTILLSCWDEIEKEVDALSPQEFLQQKVPMFANFIRNNWAEESWEVHGLSALGKPLSKESRDPDFIQNGPEHQGWVVTQNGMREADLCIPLAAAIRKLLA